MVDLKLSDVRPFLPSKDFALSKDFYTALGWAIKYADDNIALLENGSHRFYLQNYYTKEFAENTMLLIAVEDAKACAEQIEELLATGRFQGVRCAGPKREPYGALVTYVWDPAGVLLHLAQWIDE